LNTTVVTVIPNEVPSYVSFSMFLCNSSNNKRTWVIVVNKAPAILCSWGKTDLATNNDPVGNTKSTPRTENHVAGNSKAQYVIDGLVKVNRLMAALVVNVPTPETSGKISKMAKEI
jgi:hypothetical protein